MSKYIDAEKLIAYFNKTMESYKAQMVDPRKYPLCHIDLMALLAREYQAIIAEIAVFPRVHLEVDLEAERNALDNEIARFVEGHYRVRYDGAVENGCDLLTVHDVADIARHFYELGLNARKEE